MPTASNSRADVQKHSHKVPSPVGNTPFQKDFLNHVSTLQQNVEEGAAMNMRQDEERAAMSRKDEDTATMLRELLKRVEDLESQNSRLTQALAHQTGSTQQVLAPISRQPTPMDDVEYESSVGGVHDPTPTDSELDSSVAGKKDLAGDDDNASWLRPIDTRLAEAPSGGSVFGTFSRGTSRDLRERLSRPITLLLGSRPATPTMSRPATLSNFIDNPTIQRTWASFRASGYDEEPGLDFTRRRKSKRLSVMPETGYRFPDDTNNGDDEEIR